MDVKKAAKGTFNFCAWGAAAAGIAVGTSLAVHEAVDLCGKGVASASNEVGKLFEPQRN